MTAQTSGKTAPEAPAADPAAAAPLPVLETPRDGVPLVIDTAAGLERAARALAAGTGPAGVDAERASGFRYGQRAFLVQIRREGAGTWLIDPEPLRDLSIINEALRGVEWILHASTQDLPCLSELGMWPDKLFDTELAARLAGLPRVGLAAVIESLLGFSLAKEHSAADWSTRPLPEPWLRYAALDVEVLAELREELIKVLEADGKLEYAEEEFEAIRSAEPAPPRTDPWRRTSGMHQLRDRRQLAAVRELWTEREQLAERRDTAPGRLIPDSAIVAAARAMPSTVPALLGTPGFHGRAAQKEAPRWLRCIAAARDTEDLPPLHIPTHAPPPPRVWARNDPAAAARLHTAKPRLAAQAERLNLPVENLLTPDHLRRIAWRPPTPIDLDTVSEALRSLGAREWQIRESAAILTVAFLDPDPLPEKE
ncbi:MULTISPECIES: HRDC domain-containing protein [Arthrobacter]|uniref:HRDC domain-containing protein n=1 Tax=Arthrobacter TaxID=1663 RepID=UPI001D13582B|nr:MULTISPECIES: HRDC domain-containing protein [Arthrobacter]MCC3283815.1 HRDC domain-containing protein [Arthrobacter caoxuetaonis]MCC9193253.1 HRDC domain-containing protein [Arthrobacter sp. zg-Y916]